MRRQAAATPPRVRSKGAPGARQASPRVLATAGVIVLIAIVAVVLGIVLTRGNGGSTPSSGNADGPSIAIVSGTPAGGALVRMSEPGSLSMRLRTTGSEQPGER